MGSKSKISASNKLILEEICVKIRDEFQKNFDAGDKKNGKSGYKGQYKIQLGIKFIKVANESIQNIELKEELKKRGNRLINQGKADCHPNR